MAAEIEFEITGTIVLTPREVFPDGVPDEFDAEDVAEAARKCRSVTRWLSDWNLERDVEVRAYVNGEGVGVFR